MTFAETYREERLINRRSRARKARIAGRMIGFALMTCAVIALRTDPQLRGVVTHLAVQAMGLSGAAQGDAVQAAQTNGIEALGYAADSQEARTVEALGITQSEPRNVPVVSRMPQSRVQVNRP